jgi:hypothetical protein
MEMFLYFKEILFFSSEFVETGSYFLPMLNSKS